MLLFLAIEIPSIAATRTDPVVASFDCQKAQSIYETLVCKDYGLAAADIRMSGAYRHVLALTPDEDKKKTIVEQQRKWLLTTNANLDEQVKQNANNETLKKMLDKTIYRRISDFISVEIQNEKIVMLTKSTKDKSICSSILKKENISAIEPDESDEPENSGQNYFNLSPPSNFTLPNWEHKGTYVTHAEFDFMNIGKPTDVYHVSFSGTRVWYEYYIAAKPEEKKSIEEKLINTVEINEIADFAENLTLARKISWKPKKPPEFESKLFDSSSSPIMTGGWYNNTKIIQNDKTTYLITTSVNNRSGPTFVIFKPQPTGLDAICYYRVSSKH